MISKREFMAGVGASASLLALPAGLLAETKRPALAFPPLLDATKSGNFQLVASEGESNFLGRAATRTWGFNQPYLGPTLRLRNQGTMQARIDNNLRQQISVHWHGLIAPGNVDGGPHQPVPPKSSWTPELPIQQMPATIWYHSHIHGKTAPQVYRGLAGVIHLTDGQDAARALPADYGQDDLTLVLQDRRFDNRGRMVYAPSMPDRMMGFAGNVMMVNGQVGPVARVPKAIVRLRFLNASNARVLTLSMSEGRTLHLIGTDSGLLDRPVPLQTLMLAPAERAEVLVDFSDGADGLLVTGPNPNSGMMGRGMMGGMMGGRRANTGMEVLPFVVDGGLPARITRLPDRIGGGQPDLDPTNAPTRHFTLEMGMGGMFRRSGRFAINGRPFKMNYLNERIQRNITERWVIDGQMMMHPFHVHGVAFQVFRENGREPKAQNRGWKDTILVQGQAEILLRFAHPASPEIPYMFHCHILEHEDGGMMGQFSVS